MSKKEITKLKDYKVEIDKILEDFFKEKIQEYEHVSPFVKLFLEDLSEFTLRGGKRLRPALMYYTYSAFSTKNLNEIKRVSIYLELIQSFLLIHDDIMDRASLRRDGKTIHKIFEEYSKENKYMDDIHFGNTMGILNGDLACLFAYEIINNSNLDSKSKSKLSTLVSKEISEVIFGQIQDVLLTYKKEYSQEDILDVHRYKTAVYTFRLPVISGAMLAGVDKKLIKNLQDYSIASGIAFQIRDDILGVFGDDKKVGKGTISDISEGKKTLLVSHAYANSNKKQKIILDEALGNINLTNEQAESFRKVVKETGSLDYSIKECENYVKKAKSSLNKVGKSSNPGIEFLSSITDYLLEREY